MKETVDDCFIVSPFLTCPEVGLTIHVSSSSSSTAESLAYPSCLILPLCKLLSSPIMRFPVSCRQSFPGFLSSRLAASFNCCCLSHDNLGTRTGGRPVITVQLSLASTDKQVFTSNESSSGREFSKRAKFQVNPEFFESFGIGNWKVLKGIDRRKSKNPDAEENLRLRFHLQRKGTIPPLDER